MWWGRVFVGSVFLLAMGCHEQLDRNYEFITPRHKKEPGQEIILIHIEDHGYADEVSTSSPPRYRSTMPFRASNIYKGIVESDPSQPYQEYIRTIQEEFAERNVGVKVRHEGKEAGFSGAFSQHECSNIPYKPPQNCLNIKLLELVGFDPATRDGEGALDLHRPKTSRYRAWSKDLLAVVDDHNQTRNRIHYDSDLFDQEAGQFSEYYGNAVVVFVVHTNKDLSKPPSSYRDFVRHFFGITARVRLFVIYYGTFLRDHSRYQEVVDHVGGALFSNSHLSTAKDLADKLFCYLSQHVFKGDERLERCR